MIWQLALESNTAKGLKTKSLKLIHEHVLIIWALKPSKRKQLKKESFKLTHEYVSIRYLAFRIKHNEAAEERVLKTYPFASRTRKILIKKRRSFTFQQLLALDPTNGTVHNRQTLLD